MIKFQYNDPFIGERLDVSQTPDEVFSQKLLGPGFVYMPHIGRVVSPIDGEITMIFPTGHAIAIKHLLGFEVLIHVGLDSVQLKGQGFNHVTKVGSHVKMGDLLLTFDLERLQNEAVIASPVVFVQRQQIALESIDDKTHIQTYILE